MGAAHTKEDGPQAESGDIVEGGEKGGTHVFEFHGPSALVTLLCCLVVLAAAGIVYVLWQTNNRHKRLLQGRDNQQLPVYWKTGNGFIDTANPDDYRNIFMPMWSGIPQGGPRYNQVPMHMELPRIQELPGTLPRAPERRESPTISGRPSNQLSTPHPSARTSH